MIKLVCLIRRRPDLTHEQFSTYWMEKHAQLALRTAPQMRLHRYVQTHRRSHPASGAFQHSRGCLMPDYDGITEAWWDSFEDMVAGGMETPVEVLQSILDDEQKFVDWSRSAIWFGEEFQILPVTANAANQKVQPVE